MAELDLTFELEADEINLYGQPPTMTGGGGAVDSVNGETGEIVLTQDDIADGITAKQYTQTEKTKLAGIADGATANDTDANLKNRSNHTGTQTASTISDFSAAADARIAATSIGRYGRPFRVQPNEYFLSSQSVGTGYSATGVSSTAANSNGRGKITPFYISEPTTIDALALHCIATNAGVGAVIRLGIYADNNGRPGDIVIDAGTASINTATLKTLTFSPIVLQPGFYWAIGATQNLDTAGGNPTFSSVTGGQTIGIVSAPASNNMFPLATVTLPGVLTANPSLTVAASTSGTVFHIWIRRSA